MNAQQSHKGIRHGECAVVVGGSIIGLIAARVLSEHFDRVVVLERDVRPDSPAPRKGVPQGWHIHALLDRGRSIIADLFPGIFDRMENEGAIPADSVRDLAWHHHGVWKARFESGLNLYLQSRPFLEWHIRQTIAADYPQIEILYETETQELLTTPDHKRITGVRYRQAGSLHDLNGDWVVDASGRGTRFPRWIADMGFQQPVEEQVKVNIGYTSRLYEQTQDPGRDWAMMMIFPEAPNEKRIGYIAPVETAAGETRKWVVTLTGCFGEHAEMTDESFLEYARGLSRPDIYETIKNATPVSDFSAYKFPASRQLLYEKNPGLPDGFVAVGDAFCSFNPINGQGITVGSMSVEVLRNCLRKGSLKRLQSRYFKQAAAMRAVPWMLTTTEDFRYPEAEGPRPFGLRILHWYVGAVSKLAAFDHHIYMQFVKVLHFLQKPPALFHPYIFFRVVQWSLGLYGRKQEEALDMPRLKQLKPGFGDAAS